MTDEKLLGRITANPEIFGGKPVIRGMRISVELILSLLAQSQTPEAILADYPDLEREDVHACLAYAHAAIPHDRLDSLQVAKSNEIVDAYPTLSEDAVQGTLRELAHEKESAAA